MPVRICLACRRRGGREEFFRMVAAPGGEVAVELDSRLPGRGANCCFRWECLRAALKGGRLERALRRRVRPPAPEALAAHLRRLLRERIEGMLAAGGRKRAVSAGRDAARRAVLQGKEGGLFLAADLSAGSRREMAGWAAAAGELPLRMEEVGKRLSRKPAGVIFVADREFADVLALRCAQLKSLAGVEGRGEK